MLKAIKNLDIPDNNLIAVAVSGGIDSLALALSLLQCGYKPIGLIVDHKLRNVSTEHSIKTKEILQKMGIESIILTWQHENITKNLEEQARQNRYELLTQKCNDLGIKYLFLGHHADDQIETFLLNLSRGSGLDGLCSMPVERKLNGVILVRPFLSIYKKDLRLFLEKNSINWLEDETNDDDKIKRNKLRKIMHKLLPDLYKKRILLAIDNLQQTKEVMDKHYSQIFIQTITWQNNAAVFDRNKYMLLLPSERTWLLNSIFMQIKNSDKKLRLSQIKTVDNNIFKNVKKSTLAYCKITIADNVIIKLH